MKSTADNRDKLLDLASEVRGLKPDISRICEAYLRVRSISRIKVLVLAAAIVGSASMVYYHLGLLIPRAEVAFMARGLGNGNSFGNDLYQVWLTSKQWLRGHGDLYSQEMTRRIQTGLYGRALDPTRPADPIDRRAFPYPAFTDLIFWPIAEFPFSAARVIFTALLMLLTAISVYLWFHALGWEPRRLTLAIALLLVLGSYPTLEGLFAGQIGLFVLFVFSLAMWSIRRGRFFLAGFLMALTTVKPQVTALVIFHFFLWSFSGWRIRKTFVFGFASLFAPLLLGSLIASPHWIPSWLRAITAYHRYTPPPLVTQVLAVPLGAPFADLVSFVVTLAMIVVALGCGWHTRHARADSDSFRLTLSVMAAVTVIALLPGLAIYDHLILVPAVLTLCIQRRAVIQSGTVGRVLLSLGALLLFWPWITAPILLVLRHWIASSTFYSAAVFALPIRSAVPLPFVVLALLWWTWRVSSRSGEAA